MDPSGAIAIGMPAAAGVSMAISTGDVISIVILIILVLLSAFFSSSETALTTVNKIRIRNLAEDKVKNADLVAKLSEDPNRLLSTILIGNNIVNLSASALMTTFVANLFGSWAVGIGTGLLTIIVLIFGEIVPKTAATIQAEKMALRYAQVIYFLTKLLTPVIAVLNVISSVIMKIMRIDAKKPRLQITEDELLTLVEVSHEEGVIENEERLMITNVVDFGDSLAKDVMVPRMEMSAVPDDISYNDLVAMFEKDKYSRLPVYSESIDNVIGVVHLKDVCFYQGNKKEFKVTDFLRDAYFTYEFKKTSELLIEMRQATYSMSIVLDEYGATAGLITLEDLLEEIVGEIRDEYDADEEDDIQETGDHEYVVSGTTKLDDFNEFFDTHLSSDDYDSIAGHVIGLFEHLPAEGETIADGRITFTVEAVDKNRIDKLHILVSPEASEFEEEDKRHREELDSAS